jgi:hypothetical protein
MCGPDAVGSTTGTERRTFLKVLGAGGAAVWFSSATTAPAFAARRKRCYVLVLDGCRPDEIGGGLMPTVQALRDGGKNYPRASSLPIMETIPNHVMMMTGVRPDRNGVPANSIYDRALGDVRDLDRASDIRTTTVINQLNRSGRTTGTVLSKRYLYGVFGTRATHRWEPQPVVPVSGHAPDVFTMDAAISMVEELDPHFVFVNLGDIDRMGHSDLTGTTVEAARRVALAETDKQVKRFVDLLKSSGRWASSMLVVLADHSMDWSLPHQLISLQPLLDADLLLANRVRIAQNGGADLLYWTGADSRRPAAIARMREIAKAHPGVLSAYDRKASRPWLRLGDRAGDVVVWCRAGWRFSDPAQTSNPIPGNHGHPATYPIPFFLAGGHPAVPRRVTSSDHARTQDVAPTVAQFFGLSAPRGGWDGHARL